MTDTLNLVDLKHTLVHILKDNMEDLGESNRIAEWADQNVGKRLTTKTAPEGYTIREQYRSTYLDNAAYTAARYRDADPSAGPQFSFIVAHQDTNVLIPSSQEFRETNACYFSAAQKRNEQRLALLADSAHLRALASALVACRQALAAVSQATNSFDNPDHYRMIEAAGLGEVKIGRLML